MAKLNKRGEELKRRQTKKGRGVMITTLLVFTSQTTSVSLFPGDNV
jgi:hypothetical protein